MIRGAGIIILTGDGLALFVKRGTSSDHPGEWCYPGGCIEDGETPVAAAIRETLEEVGYTAEEADLTFVTCTVGPDPLNVTGSPEVSGSEPVEFTTFLCKIAAPFVPALHSTECTAYAWAPLCSPPEPLHCGCAGPAVRIYGNELEIARAMAAGQLPSPQVYRNMHLWNIRITGTGFSYRPSIDEFVFRKPELYLNEDFLARCNGLSVILYHAATGAMDSDEFGKRIVGSVFVPYIRGDDVWAIAKVYDDETNQLMLDHPDGASTSPMVILGSNDNLKLQTEEGRPVLFEGEPVLLDHIALLPKGTLGVWDKGEGPSGVDRSAVVERADAAHAEVLERADAYLSLLNIELSLFAHRRARRSVGKSI